VVTTSRVKAIRLTTQQLRIIAHASPAIAERLHAAIAEREQRLL
jgi:hypothetical protein